LEIGLHSKLKLIVSYFDVAVCKHWWSKTVEMLAHTVRLHLWNTISSE
jgi:hypothetical protein